MSVFRGANPFDQLTKGVKFLVTANVVVFLLQMALPRPTIEVFFGLTPLLVLTKYWIWQLITYAFLHGNGWHLFFNMFALWMFGPHIESLWGTKTFLRYYFVCSVGAALCQFFLAPEVMVLGASGAIYGLLLAFGFLFPDAVIYLFFFFPLRAIQAVLFIALLTLVSAVGSGGGRVAHFAHLGGMLTGFLWFKFPGWLAALRLWQADRRFRNPLGKRKHHRRTPITEFEVHSPTDDMSAEVDRILEKISAKGLDSLTKEEHETMRKYGERKK
ncbi:MAG: hypothetical protein KCHDKBKB_00398 [Elusimicrobia bacterium]|nr:hypothetical protein [Elusimicrobiota bacterium]